MTSNADTGSARSGAAVSAVPTCDGGLTGSNGTTWEFISWVVMPISIAFIYADAAAGHLSWVKLLCRGLPHGSGGPNRMLREPMGILSPSEPKPEPFWCTPTEKLLLSVSSQRGGLAQ